MSAHFRQLNATDQHAGKDKHRRESSTVSESSRTSESDAVNQQSSATTTTTNETPVDLTRNSRRQSSLVVLPPEQLNKSTGKDVVPFRASNSQLCKVSMRQYDVYTDHTLKVNPPSERSQQFSQPIIVVEPRNDDSVQCDCRGCQFFSGWCCTPCILFIIMIIVLVAILAPGSHNNRHSEAPAKNITVINNSTAAPTTSTDGSTGSRYAVPSWLDAF